MQKTLHTVEIAEVLAYVTSCITHAITFFFLKFKQFSQTLTLNSLEVRLLCISDPGICLTLYDGFFRRMKKKKEKLTQVARSIFESVSWVLGSFLHTACTDS